MAFAIAEGVLPVPVHSLYLVHYSSIAALVARRFFSFGVLLGGMYLSACQVYDDELLSSDAEQLIDGSMIRDDAAVDETNGQVTDIAAAYQSDNRLTEPKGGDTLDPYMEVSDGSVFDDRSDSQTSSDTDQDGSLDECPDDEDKTTPGICGCGIPDQDSDDATSCYGIVEALIHRYRFEGSGTSVADSVGMADIRLRNLNLIDTGKLMMPGDGSDAYGILPNGIVSTLTDATIEFWIIWQGGDIEQRVISLGTAVPSPPNANCIGSPEFFNGSWYLFCTDLMDWLNARALCETAGGELLSIENLVEQQYIDVHPGLIGNTWFAANDRQTEGQWHWATREGIDTGDNFWIGEVNGSPVSGAFTNWRTNQPDNWDGPDYDEEDCAMLFTDGMWMDTSCGTDRNVACEWRGHRGTTTDRGLWFTPADSEDRPSFRFKTTSGTTVAQAKDAFPIGTEVSVALVIDNTQATLQLYIDGMLAATADNADSLSTLRDMDNFIGRSHVNTDPAWNGSINELRIYRAALSAEHIAVSARAGTDPDFFVQ